MEGKVYERQVSKIAISKRVIDKHQIDRHYTEADLMELYKTDIEPTKPRPKYRVPDDPVLARQLHRLKNTIYKYHDHDNLLENNLGTLSAKDAADAWSELEAELSGRIPLPPLQSKRMELGRQKISMGYAPEELRRRMEIFARNRRLNDDIDVLLERYENDLRADQIEVSSSSSRSLLATNMHPKILK